LVTLRIQTTAHPDVWQDVRTLTDEALAKRIVEDGIDVLIDLSGHTGDNRLLSFARRPAPVQVTYCGYPSTTGLAAMGWRLTDEVADPLHLTDGRHAERLWRLPNGFLCFQPDRDGGAPGPSPSLARGLVTFGSFNNLSKVGDGVMDVWAQILRSVPGSHLLLKSRALSDEEPRDRLRGTFLRLGIEADRLEFASYAATPREHLALYERVDVALDPFPYTGTTTTCEALWMGVPVVTLAGVTHAGRVGASLLTRIGCNELVADTRSAYVDIAAGLARNPDRLVAYRRDLRERMKTSPLTSPGIITRDIETAYREMWRLWCSSARAESAPAGRHLGRECATAEGSG
jgi:predicted O-linked N-acetylglucosamine transferase (SPINDLY family)